MKRITLTFKKHEVEMYNFIYQFSSPTAHIKDLIKKDMEGRKDEGGKYIRAGI